MINNSGGTKVATDFTFQVNGAAAVTFLQDGADTLAGKNTVSTTVGTDIRRHRARGRRLHDHVRQLRTTSASLAAPSATCTITNNDKPAT